MQTLSSTPYPKNVYFIQFPLMNSLCINEFKYGADLFLLRKIFVSFGYVESTENDELD